MVGEFNVASSSTLSISIKGELVSGVERVLAGREAVDGSRPGARPLDLPALLLLFPLVDVDAAAIGIVLPVAMVVISLFNAEKLTNQPI